MAMRMRLREIATLVGGEVRGDPERPITEVAALEEAGPTEIAVLAFRRYLERARSSRAGALLTSHELAVEGRDQVLVANPYLAFSRVLALFHSPPACRPGIHPTAIVGERVGLGEGVAIGPYAVVGDDAVLEERVRIGALVYIGEASRIGAGTQIYPHVTIRERVQVGRRCIIHPGVVLGADGFGFATDAEGHHHKLLQLGDLRIGDDVEIGANCTIDRGALGSTLLGRGTKLDNLVHIAHNVQVGEDSLFTAQVGVAGSTRLGKGVVLGGQAGLVGHLEIGDGARIGAQAGVIKSVKPGETVSGYPARPHREAMRREALVSRLPEMERVLRELRARVEALERERAQRRGPGD